MLTYFILHQKNSKISRWDRSFIIFIFPFLVEGVDNNQILKNVTVWLFNKQIDENWYMWKDTNKV